MAAEALTRYGWSAEWRARLEKIARDRGRDDAHPGRVLRHHGVTVELATAQGIEAYPLRRGLTTPPVVGDWMALAGDTLLDVLPRTSLLERRATRSETPHPLVANVDRTLITCGIDRPLNAGRIQRTATLAWEAGAPPTIVITKADLCSPTRLAAVAEHLAGEHPGLGTLATSSVTGTGLDELGQLIGHGTVALLGESGSGKSSLVNALARHQVAATGEVRDRDRKGRHTTTGRELHPLPGGGIVVDTPGLRSVGLWGDTDSVDATFDDLTELAGSCRFRDCAHHREPGCAVRAAVDDGRLDPQRLAAFRDLAQEAAASTPAGAPKRGRRRG